MIMVAQIPRVVYISENLRYLIDAWRSLCQVSSEPLLLFKITLRLIKNLQNNGRTDVRRILINISLSNIF